jgi:hypothetical protein
MSNKEINPQLPPANPTSLPAKRPPSKPISDSDSDEEKKVVAPIPKIENNPLPLVQNKSVSNQGSTKGLTDPKPPIQPDSKPKTSSVASSQLNTNKSQSNLTLQNNASNGVSTPKSEPKIMHSIGVGGQEPQKEPRTEQQRYMQSLTEIERTQYNNLIQKNMKMRGELIDIATAMDNMTDSERASKIKNLYNILEENEEVAELEQQLVVQQEYINEINVRLKQRRQQFQENYKLNDLEDKENQLVFLKKKLEEVSKEKAALEKIIGKQVNDMEDLQMQEQKMERVDLFERRSR